MASRFLRSGALALLALGLLALIPACGDEDVPAPTTPAPAPPPPAPAPPPAPEPPAAPGGLRISATGPDFIEWSWTPVSGATGYDVQYSANEAFTDEDETIPRTAEEISYRRTGLEPGTRGYLRVRAAVGTGDERLTGAWSSHLMGVADAAEPAPEPPAMPSGLEISERGQDFIEWSWDPVPGVSGYDVQFSTNEVFTDEDELIARTAEQTSYRRERLEPETSYYLRVRAAAGTGDARVTSAWTSHLTGMTMAARPPAPTGLEVTGATDTTMTWRWDAVAGADGYQLQHSDSATIPDNTQGFYTNATTTTFTASSLPSRETRYARVRAYFGTISEPVFGVWSATVSGTTEQATVTQLNRPTRPDAGSRTRTSITLTWVDDANDEEDVDRYEVRQRPEDGNWGVANCGTSGEFVTTQRCVATGLEQGTDYEFGVRAHPDSDDDTKRESEWSLPVSAATTGQQQEEEVTSGEDDMNLEWTSDATSITWDWDPVANRADRERIDHWVFVTNATTTECPAVTEPAVTVLTSGAWANLGKNISAALTTTVETGLDRGMVRTLCVVRTWEHDLGNGLKVRRYGTPAVMMAATSPDNGPATTNPVFSENDEKQETTRIEWEYRVDRGFRYPGQVVSVSRDDELPTGPNICQGTSVNSPAAAGRDNVSVRHRETVGPANAYKRYRFCVRAENDDGASDWQPIGTANSLEVLTLPGKPGNPSYDSAVSDIRTHSSGSHVVQKLVWSVAITDRTPAPQESTNYDSKVLISKKTSATADVCEPATPPADYTLIDSPASAEVDTLGGIGITLTATSAAADAADLLDDVDDLDNRYYYACVKAMPSSESARSPAQAGGSTVDDEGPWVVGRSAAFRRNLGTPTLAVSPGASGQINITVGTVTGATGYELEERTAAASGTPAGDWATSETVENGTATDSASVRTDYQVRAVTTVRGDTVNGRWSSVKSANPGS